MNVRQAVLDGAAKLSSAGLPDSRLESELLLAGCLDADRTQLCARLGDEIDGRSLEEFERRLQRRSNFEPAAYILGKREFYGIDLYVDKRVLIPRPESELLVEEALRFLHPHLSSPVEGEGNCGTGRPRQLADIGTGSGALAIALALALPTATIMATDISFEALQVAQVNIDRLGLSGRISLLCGDTVRPLPAPVDVLVANLPYVSRPDFAKLEPGIRDYEPSVALYGGKDGLEVIRRLVPRLGDKVKPGGLALIEADPRQMPPLEEMVRLWLPCARTERLKDLGGKDRVLRVAL